MLCPAGMAAFFLPGMSGESLPNASGSIPPRDCYLRPIRKGLAKPGVAGSGRSRAAFPAGDVGAGAIPPVWPGAQRSEAGHVGPDDLGGPLDAGNGCRADGGPNKGTPVWLV